jgi:hypothetical protein
VRNHSVADLNLREETIHDYIHHCTVFGMTYFGRKPRWVLQYLQSGPDDAAIPALENPSPPQHKMETPPDEGLSRQRTEITRGASRPSRSAPSPPRGVRKENPVAAAMQGIAAAVSPAPAHAALDGIAGAISPPSPRTSPSDGFVGMQVHLLCAALVLRFACGGRVAVVGGRWRGAYVGALVRAHNVSQSGKCL